MRWRKDDGEWSAPRTIYGLSCDISGLHEGTYTASVVAVNALGVQSPATNSPTFSITDVGHRTSQKYSSMLTVGGIRSAWTGFTITYTATPTSATINCTAGTLQDGVSNPTYAASSATVSGTGGTTTTYYLYYDDAPGAGGTLALGTTTTYSDLSANQGRIFVGQVDVAFPTSGSSSGGGSPGGGGGCVTVDMWLMDGLAAGRVQVGQAIDGATYDPVGMVDRIVESNLILPQPCMRLVTESGCVVEASRSTPMTMPDGSLRMFTDMLGELALVNDRGAIRWEHVTALEDIGIRPVVLIRMSNQCYFAGAQADRRVATHNPIAVK